MTNRGGGHLAHRLIDTILLRQLLFAVAVAVVVLSCLYWINVGINNDQQTKISVDSWLMMIYEMVPFALVG